MSRVVLIAIFVSISQASCGDSSLEEPTTLEIRPDRSALLPRSNRAGQPIAAQKRPIVDAPPAPPSSPRWVRDETLRTADSLLGVWGSSPADLFTVGLGGTVFHRAHGAIWTRRPRRTTVHLVDVWGSGPEDVFAVGAHGTILHSSDGGMTWDSRSAGGPGVDLAGIWGNADGLLVAVGQGGHIARSTDGGRRWATIRIPRGARADLLAVWGKGTHVWAVGVRGTIVHSVDLGAHWSAQTSGTRKSLTAVRGRAEGLVVAVGEEGTILATADSGETWQARESRRQEDLYDVVAVDDGPLWAVGNRGTILRSDDGQSWDVEESGTNNGLRGVWAASAHSAVAVGMAGTVVRLEE